MSSNGDRGSGIGDRLDTAIDLAVREMLDVEPPPGLRGRVMDRIELHGPVASADHPVASAFRRNPFAWLAAPIAAAAIVIVAVMAPWRETGSPVEVPPPVVARVNPPATLPPPAPSKMPEAPRAVDIRLRHSTPPAVPVTPRAVVAAASVATAEDINFSAVEALAPPPSIAVANLPDPVPSSIRSIEPAALQIRPLEITALPEAPRERREE